MKRVLLKQPTRGFPLATVVLVLAGLLPPAVPASDLELERGDHIAYIGNTLADRMQHHPWLETYIHALHPEHELTFRNLGFSGDEITRRTRSANFGSPDEWLTKVEADVVFCFFGRNEALRGEAGLPGFKKDLAEMIDGMRGKKYNGESPPRLVVFSPIAHEDLKSPHLPDGSARNENLALYTDAMRKVSREKDVRFVDLFAASRRLYGDAPEPLTLNGIHLLERGNKALAEVIAKELFSGAEEVTENDAALARLYEAVLEKNCYWFSRYRVVDGYNVYGGRSKLSWFGQSNADVMRREMEIFDIMTRNRDVAVWAAARGREHEVMDDNLPELLEVRTNKPGKLPGERHPYLGAEEAIDEMTVAEGMEVNLFASEEMFPEMINPVQMAVDTDGRLFVAVWPSYPHWNPTQPRTDRIVCLPDENADGVADRCIVFADELNSVTGFEFWGGGMLVAAPPEIWFLEDTDGDDAADKKIRMLQGLSSADTHHTANAMVIGPDGWLYWSRGIFNVAAMETPTKVYRSGTSGVHRFNPRTFEVEFHFPIGPNPHGDVFDQWGYQFANDGTSGTGSYVNIGKGRGNRQWFEKRVRPVAATGILSSSHFPEENQGNFLICNTIGVRAVLQHEVRYDGADIRAEEIEPIVQSADPNFRPTDVEIGGDGALYISDWCNVLIGHMQHNMRDPNRDHEHGRIYRVTAKGRSLLEPYRLEGKPIEEVLQAFFAKETPNRYRARLELSGRETPAVMSALESFTSRLSPAKPDEAQALLECLWVREEHRVPDLELVEKVFRADEPRVRAAAIRTLGHWGPRAFHTPGAITDGWQPVLKRAARDPSPLVRAEAVKAAVEFEGAAAAEVIFEVATREIDSELEAVLGYAREAIDVDAMVADAIRSGRDLSPAAEAYALRKASVSALLEMERSDAVYEALLSREGVPAKYRREAIRAMAKKNGRSETEELIARIADAETKGRDSLGDLARMLASAGRDDLSRARPALERLASDAPSPVARTAAYAAWIRSGAASEAWDHASRSRASLGDFLGSLEHVDSDDARATLYPRIRSLMFELPEHLGRGEEESAGAVGGPPVAFEYYEPLPARNVATETLDRAEPKLEGKLERFETFVPGGRRDAFATRQTASIRVERPGKYTFYTASDDGSRLYIDGRLVIQNDGLHGMREKSGSLELDAGLHEIVVTYFDNGGGDGLVVSWKGPGFDKQRIPERALRPRAGGSLRARAMDVIAGWPGHLDGKIGDFANLVASASLVEPALGKLAGLPTRSVVRHLSRESAATVLSALLAKAGKATPVERQSEAYLGLLDLGDALIGKAGADRESIARELAELRASIPVKADPKVMELGKEVFLRDSHCATCHQPHGQGLPNLYPPLDGSIWVTGSEDRLIRIVLDGLHGVVQVKGKTWSSPPLPPMTGFRHLLGDEEIAAALTYVRNSWSNRARPVEPEEVASVRAEDRGDATFWNAADLLAKYPLEDGSEAVARTSGWAPRFVKAWKVEDFEKDAKPSAGDASFENGRLAFQRLGCAQCHRLGGEGGVFGPDLAALDPEKRNPEHVLRSLIEPSKDVDEKFALYAFVMDSGEVVSGLVVEETKDEVRVVSDPLASDKPEVLEKDRILQRSKTDSSIMPEGLVNWLTREEVLDLVAYVLAGGDANAAVYRGGGSRKSR